MLAVNADGLTAPQVAQHRYTAIQAELCRRDLRKFIRRAWAIFDPAPLKAEWHIDAICEHLAYVALGEIRNLMIIVPPRCTKSLTCSVAFPAWVWTNEPEQQFLCASYAADLANIHAQLMRRLVESDWYTTRYPNVRILSDENRIDRFSNTKGGYRTSISVGSKTTGLGGNILIGDDFNNAQEAESEAKRKQANEWHDNAWRSRTNDPNTARRIYVGQRTHDADVLGHVLAKEEKRWVKLELPLEYDGSRKCVTYRNKGQGNYGEPIFRDPRETPNAILCPERYNEETIESLKDSTPERTWNAQYQQKPEGAGGLILKRHWWRPWRWPDWHPQYRKTERPLPEIFELIQAYDTAFEEGEEDSYTVRTTWGMFYHEEDHKPGSRIPRGEPKVSAILLERKKWRPSFGQLRDDAIDANNIWEPERVLVEKKASGHSLIQELRKKDIPIRGVKVLGDLVYRAHMASLPLEKKAIWYIERAWSKDVIEECAKFPAVQFNDQVSSCFVSGTKVFTETGLKEIQDIVSGDLVLTHLGRLRPVLAIRTKRASDVYRLKAATLDEVRVTGNHLALTCEISSLREARPEAWKRVDELRKIRRAAYRAGKQDTLRTTIDGLALPANVRTNARGWIDTTIWQDQASPRANRYPKRLALTRQFGWILGFWLAEGSWHHEQRSVRWSQRFDKPALDMLRRYARKIFGAKLSESRTRDIVNVNLGVAAIWPLFASLGNGCDQKRLAPWMWSAPRAFREGLVEGIVAGDGHDNGKVVSVGLTSETLVQQMRLLQAGLGIHCTIGRPKRHEKNPQWKQMWVLRWYKKPTRSAACPRPNLLAYPVDVLERADGEQDVYDIQVEEDESFVTTGGTFHNCTIAWQYMRKYMDLQLEDDDNNQEDLDLFNPKLQRRHSIYG